MEIVSLLLELISTTYSQSGCDERKGKWDNIIYHIIGGGGGGGRVGKCKVSIVYSIRMGGGGGGGGRGEELRYHCAPSPH